MTKTNSVFPQDDDNEYNTQQIKQKNYGYQVTVPHNHDEDDDEARLFQNLNNLRNQEDNILAYVKPNHRLTTQHKQLAFDVSQGIMNETASMKSRHSSEEKYTHQREKKDTQFKFVAMLQQENAPKVPKGKKRKMSRSKSADILDTPKLEDEDRKEHEFKMAQLYDGFEHFPDKEETK